MIPPSEHTKSALEAIEEAASDITLIPSGRHSLVLRLRAAAQQVREMESKIDRFRMQMAGIGVVAHGGTSEAVLVHESDFGWSVPYDDVLNLRRKFDEQAAELATLKADNERLAADLTTLTACIEELDEGDDYWIVKRQATTITALKAELATLRAQVAELTRDAERWRIVRDWHRVEWPAIDAAVTAARSAQEGKAK